MSAYTRDFDKKNTNCHNNKLPKEDCECIFLSVIFLDSVYRRDKNSGGFRRI